MAAIGVMNNAIGKETIIPITNDFTQIVKKSDTKPIDTYVITSDIRKDIANAIIPPNKMSALFINQETLRIESKIYGNFLILYYNYGKKQHFYQ